MKKFLFLTVAVLMLATFVFAGCNGSNDLGVVELPYYNDEDDSIGYNKNLFYRNDLLETGADPCVIKVTEGEYKDWFFLYGTTDTTSCTAYACWKSKDLTNWQAVSICYQPESASWGKASLWAPGVIYDPSDGKYYLFYSAQNSASGYYKTKYLGMAVSDSPAGPFVQYTGVNGNGDELTLPSTLRSSKRITPRKRSRTNAIQVLSTHVRLSRRTAPSIFICAAVVTRTALTSFPL